MELISEEYRQANLEMHQRRSGYGSHGGRWASKIVTLADEFGASSILDYGCGKGTLAIMLAPRLVNEYDPAIPGKDTPPRPADLVACTDVLEHIEPPLLQNVLADIHRLAGRVAFLNISTRLANKSLKDGRNAHLIVENEGWWRQRIEQMFDIREWAVDKVNQEVNCVTVPKPRDGTGG